MAFFKTIIRMVKSNFGRFASITAIMMVGIALMVGIGEVAPALTKTGNEYLTNRNVADIIVKSTSAAGFTATQRSDIASLGSVRDTLAYSAIDYELDGTLTRIYFTPLSDLQISKIELLEGELPKNANEIIVERSTNGLKEYSVGDTVEFELLPLASKTELTVSGIALNPLLFSREAEPSNYEKAASSGDNNDETEYEDLEAVIYFDSSFRSIPLITDMQITVNNARDYGIFTKKYEDLVSGVKAEIESLPFANQIKVLTLEENLSYAYYKANIEKIENISFVVPVFFVAVVALVILTTMTRLVEKERSVVGCYKTLGISNGKIRLKYLLFVCICAVLGSALGIVLGSLVIMPIIYSAYSTLFVLPPLSSGIYIAFGLIAAGIILATVLAITLYVVGKQLREKPAQLLKAKAPKPGKKILLEKIPIIWNRLKFKYKSTMRNIFRNAKNFIMTVISVAGGTALVFAGFGLLDAASATGVVSQARESMSLISVVIIICAAALSMLVMYNLANMIIEERRREIATLKVLGYKNIELAGYVFREVFIMALVGIIVGLPLGILLVTVIFNYVNFGALTDVLWYSYVATFLLALVFIAVVFLILYPKIVRTNMNDSLKTLE